MKNLHRKAVVVILIVLCLVLAGCNKKTEQGVDLSYSRMSTAVLVGLDDLFMVTIDKGVKEKDFVADGVTTSAVPFFSLVIVPLKTYQSDSISLVLLGGDQTSKIVVQKSENNSFASELDIDFMPSTIKIDNGDTTQDISLLDALQDKIAPTDALAIAKEHFKGEIKQDSETKKTREVYLKVVFQNDMTYYFVALVAPNNDFLAVLVDADNGEIVS